MEFISYWWSISTILYKPDKILTSDGTRKRSLLYRAFARKFTSPTVSLSSCTGYSCGHLVFSMRKQFESVWSPSLQARFLVQTKLVVTLAECAEELVVLLRKICSISTAVGTVSISWKQVNIIPILKKGTQRTTKYGSVSLLPLLANTLERLVYTQLFRHVSPVLLPE